MIYSANRGHWWEIRGRRKEAVVPISCSPSLSFPGGVSGSGGLLPRCSPSCMLRGPFYCSSPGSESCFCPSLITGLNLLPLPVLSVSQHLCNQFAVLHPLYLKHLSRFLFPWLSPHPFYRQRSQMRWSPESSERWRDLPKVTCLVSQGFNSSLLTAEFNSPAPFIPVAVSLKYTRKGMIFHISSFIALSKTFTFIQLYPKKSGQLNVVLPG